MKRSEEMRFPQSAELFLFCKEALSIKHKYEIKVIDQHVGSILGFDPADCSHWKRGRKNVRSLQNLKTIAEHFDLDPRFVADIVTGRMDREEALQEYKGYGAFTLDERLKNELHRDFVRRQTEVGKMSFDDYINPKRENSIAYVDDLLDRANIKSLPILIPELFEALPHIEFREIAWGHEDFHPLVQSFRAGDYYVIAYRAGEMRPHIRFLLAREIGRIFYYPQLTTADAEDIVNIRINTFALHLLMPTRFLRRVSWHVVPHRDLVDQLAEMFWISRTLVNYRMQDFCCYGN